MSLTDEPNPMQQTRPTGDRRAELERIKDAMWPPDESAADRQAGIARAVAALASLPKWNVDPKIIKQVLEDPDNEYYGS